MNIKRKRFIIPIALLLIAALAYLLLPTKPSGDTAEHQAFNNQGTYNILLLGVDGNNFNTDTIVLASFNAKDHTLNLLSIPRDTMSNVSRSVKKINAAYGVGGHANIAQTKKEITMLTGIPIDRYVLTTFDGFVKAVDAIGGVPIDVPTTMSYRDPYQNLIIDLEKGQQVLDGQKSLKFVRYRAGYIEGDLGRVKAQQLFFKALGKQLLSPSNVPKIPDLANIVANDMKTDLTKQEMLWFAREASGVNLDTGIEMFILPGTPKYVNSLSYYLPDEKAILALVNTHFNPTDTPFVDLDIININTLQTSDGPPAKVIPEPTPEPTAADESTEETSPTPAAEAQDLADGTDAALTPVEHDATPGAAADDLTLHHNDPSEDVPPVPHYTSTTTTEPTTPEPVSPAQPVSPTQ